MPNLSRTMFAAGRARGDGDIDVLAGAVGIQVGHGLPVRRSRKNDRDDLGIGAKGHDAMMMNATKVQDNTVFFMQGRMYMVSGIVDAAGNFSRQ